MRACVIAFLLVFTTYGISAQTAPAFDVVSVKPSPPWQPGMAGGGISFDPTHFTATLMPVRSLIISAWDLPVWTLAGVEPWLISDGYDVRATMPPNTPQEQLKPMIRTLLADRFGLRFHRETREAPIYALVVTKDGPKIKPSSDDKFSAKRGPGHLEFRHIDMKVFVRNIVEPADRPIIDMTGLDGFFDIKLDWTPDTNQPASSQLQAPKGGPSVFTAFQEQLGLKLEARKGPVEYFVIDHIERPSEN